MSWPLSQDYNEAIQTPKSNFADPDLRRGEAATNALGLPMPYSGNFADVYQVRCPDGRVGGQVLHPAGGGAARALPGDQPPPEPGEAALHGGLHLSGAGHPRGRDVVSRLKMQWVEGLTLNQFVAQCLDKPAMLEALLQVWAAWRSICARRRSATATCSTATS